MKVFKMDDFTWYAGKTEEEAVKAWEEDCGEEYYRADEETPYNVPKECDLDKEGLWWELDMPEGACMVPHSKEKDKTNVGDRDFFYGMFCEFVSFREAIKRNGNKSGYCIACTEV